MGKKIFAVFLSALLLCSVVVFAACSNTPEENREYKYQSASFVKDKDLTFADVDQFAPMAGFGEEIDSVSELEKYILDNIDEYSIIISGENGNSRVYLKNEIDSVKISGDKIILTLSGKSGDYAFTLSDNRYVLAEKPDDKCSELGFEKGKFYYTFELTQGFAIRYYFA